MKRTLVTAIATVAVIAAIGSFYLTWSGNQGHTHPLPPAPAGTKSEKQLALDAKAGTQQSPDGEKGDRDIGGAAGN